MQGSLEVLGGPDVTVKPKPSVAAANSARDTSSNAGSLIPASRMAWSLTKNLACCRDTGLTGPPAETPPDRIASWKRINSSLNTSQEPGSIIMVKLSVIGHLPNYKLLENGKITYSSLSSGPQSTVQSLGDSQRRRLPCSERDNETQS